MVLNPPLQVVVCIFFLVAVLPPLVLIMLKVIIRICSDLPFSFSYGSFVKRSTDCLSHGVHLLLMSIYSYLYTTHWTITKPYHRSIVSPIVWTNITGFLPQTQSLSGTLRTSIITELVKLAVNLIDVIGCFQQIDPRSYT